MCMSVCLHVRLCTTYLPGIHGGQERALVSLKLEFHYKVIVSHHALGIKPRSSRRAATTAEPTLQPCTLVLMTLLFCILDF